MKITYYIDYGYVAQSKMPLHVEIPDDELADQETREEKIDLINDLVKDHFEQKVSTYWDESQLKA